MVKEVTIKITAPIECTYWQLEEWLKNALTETPIRGYELDVDEIEIDIPYGMV